MGADDPFVPVSLGQSYLVIDLDHLAHVFNVLTLFLLGVYSQRGIKGNNGDEVDYVQGVFPEFLLTGSSNQPDGQLDGEPRDARDLDAFQHGVVHLPVLVLELRHAVDAHGHDGGQHHAQGGDGDELGRQAVGWVFRANPDRSRR